MDSERDEIKAVPLCSGVVFVSSLEGATPHLFAMSVGSATVIDCEQKKTNAR